MTRRERRRLVVSLVIACVAALLISYARRIEFFDPLEHAALDYFFQEWPRGNAPEMRTALDKAVIVAIDDRTIGEFGRFGDWPRERYAQLVERLQAGGARVIAFDIGFVEPHPDDARVAAALRDFVEEPIEARLAVGAPLTRRAVISPVVGIPPTERVAGLPIGYTRGLAPRPEYLAVSAAWGHANVVPDPDGTVRKTPLLIRVSGDELPTLGLATAAAFTGLLDRGYTFDPERATVTALGRTIPVDPYAQMVVSFAGPPSRVPAPEQGNPPSRSEPFVQTVRTVSFIDVLNPGFDLAVFRDRAVFIGVVDATGFADDYNVPTSGPYGKMAGVEVHAHTFATLISSQFLSYQGYPATVAAIWLLALVGGLALFRFSILPSAIVALVGAMAFYWGALTYAALYSDIQGVTIPDPVYPPLGLLATFLGVVTYRVVIEHSEARATRGALGKYLSPAILEEVLREPDKLHLGGQKRHMTALFTDIRGFTSISEKLEPEYLLDFLNGYLTAMTDVVYDWKGVLDKYMGDAIMAWWGAPTDQPDHAYRACMTALAMRARLRELHVQWEHDGVPRLEMGIGINTGPMVYGNTGSRERFDFTVLGDAVNLASRLEGVNKEYGSNVIVSASTLGEVAGRGFVARYLDLIAVKGKSEPVAIYELIGLEGSVPAHVVGLLEAWDFAMSLYRAFDFLAAEQAFRRVLEIAPGDSPSAVYIARSIELQEIPPDPGWDGVFIMTHK